MIKINYSDCKLRSRICMQTNIFKVQNKRKTNYFLLNDHTTSIHQRNYTTAVRLIIYFILLHSYNAHI